MTAEEKQLWQKIKNFELDDPESSFCFSERLARENDWSILYSLRAIIEYKRFLFLICISENSQTPSDQVDQVWHLHLLYTQSYWVNFCGDLVKKEIHHGPTKGKEQRALFKDLYSETLKLYERKFEKKPPSDIWPDVETRISEIHFTRVNRHKTWLLPKIRLKP